MLFILVINFNNRRGGSRVLCLQYYYGVEKINIPIPLFISKMFI
jgi:hypothetical protein